MMVSTVFYLFCGPLFFPISYCFVLTKIFRQNDLEFINLLEKVEKNQVSEKTKDMVSQMKRPLSLPLAEYVPRLNPRVMERFIYNREKLHENITNDEFVIIDSIDSGTLSSYQLDQLLPVRHKSKQ